MDSHNIKAVKRHGRDKNGEIKQKRESTWKYFMFLLFKICSYSEYGGSETFYGSTKDFVVYKISYVENGYVCSILGYFSPNCRIISPSRPRKKLENKEYITTRYLQWTTGNTSKLPWMGWRGWEKKLGGETRLTLHQMVPLKKHIRNSSFLDLTAVNMRKTPYYLYKSYR